MSFAYFFRRSNGAALVLLGLFAAPAWADGYTCPTSSETRGGWTPPTCASVQPACPNCGVVEAVNAIETEEASGLGAVAGAVGGGLLGNQVGKGKGKTLATIAGAVGGGVAGHYGEKMLRKKTRWDVSVKLDDGSHRVFSFDQEPAFHSGDKVKVEGNSLLRN